MKNKPFWEHLQWFNMAEREQPRHGAPTPFNPFQSKFVRGKVCRNRLNYYLTVENANEFFLNRVKPSVLLQFEKLTSR